ncbi:MAG: hypothetical protein WBN88_19745 [Anderseniella sp.]
MQDDKVTGEEARAGRIVKKGRILRLLMISIALLVIAFLVVGYVSS